MYDLIYDFLINNFLGKAAENEAVKLELAAKMSWFTTISIFFLVFYFIYLLLKVVFKDRYRDF